MNIAQYIDHTLLKPEATEKQIIQLCKEAKQYGFHSVCVNSVWVGLCHVKLIGSGISVCSVVGFPFGATWSDIKVMEARFAVAQGADEIDMVMNVGMIKSWNVGDWRFCQKDIEMVRNAAPKAVLKVIIETCLLTDEEKVEACWIIKRSGADFVKTSTGFGKNGATVKDVRLIRKTIGYRLGVKASGGIQTYDMAKAMIEAGANRLGCSNSVAIVHEAMADEQ